jgi:hypothetical protein
VVAALTELRISPRRVRIRIGGRRRAAFAAVGVYSDGAKIELSDRVTFTSADQTIAVVSNQADRHGRVEPVAAGSTSVTATEPITGLTTRPARIVVRGGGQRVRRGR